MRTPIIEPIRSARVNDFKAIGRELRVEPFFGLWNLLRRTSTQSCARVEVNPFALGGCIKVRVDVHSSHSPARPPRTTGWRLAAL